MVASERLCQLEMAKSQRLMCSTTPEKNAYLDHIVEAYATVTTPIPFLLNTFHSAITISIKSIKYKFYHKLPCQKQQTFSMQDFPSMRRNCAVAMLVPTCSAFRHSKQNEAGNGPMLRLYAGSARGVHHRCC